MENKKIVPGFYAEIEDYNLKAISQPVSNLDKPVVLLADLPNFVYLPDTTSSDVNAVRKVMISANTLLPITDVEEAIKVLQGENIVDGLLTKEQKEELICKDIINILKMNKESAKAGQLAIVKITKRDGNRPNMENKFEVFQALENAYEKLGNINASQLVPVGISAEEDFVTNCDSVTVVSFEKGKNQWDVQENVEKIFNNIYITNPNDSYKNVELDFSLEQPKTTFETCEKGGSVTTEAGIINNNGIDSEEAKKLLTGKVLIKGTPVTDGIKLEFAKGVDVNGSKSDALIVAEEVNVEVVPGEVMVVLGKGFVFATLKTKAHSTTAKLVVAEAASGPAVNFYYESQEEKKGGKAALKTLTAGTNQSVSVDIIKEEMPWVHIVNKGNIKEEITSVRILTGASEGEDYFSPVVSGSSIVSFKVNAVNKVTDILVDDILTERVGIATVAGKGTVTTEKVVVELAEKVNLIIDKGTVIVPEGIVEGKYFDQNSDGVSKSEFEISYVPVGSEPIAKSLEYAQQLTKSLSETLVVWGVKPPTSNDPKELIKYAQNLCNVPKFKRGFKKRISASKEVDMGMFLTVVVGSQKSNGIGGVSNFPEVRVIDFERTNGGSGEHKRLTDKVFVSLTNAIKPGMNIEIKTYVGVKLKVESFSVLSVKDILGKTMVTLDKTIDTSVFSLSNFDVIISLVDTKDRKGSYTSALFACIANAEKDRAPVAKELQGVCDITFPSSAIKMLLDNKFTVISADTATKKGEIVDCPLMTRKDSDFQDRSQIGCVLYFLNKLRTVANAKKGKKFPLKEQKVLFEDEMRDVFRNEVNTVDSAISDFEFTADMSKLDTQGYLVASFRIVDTKKFKTAVFSGGLAKI